MKKFLLIVVLTFASCATAPVYAQPLEYCPSEAFLVQGSPARLYGVDLATGSYRSLSGSMGAQGVLNAISFSLHDSYLYAWDKVNQTMVRIGADYQAEQLALVSPLGGHYYVGDVSLQENAYYVYRKGSHALHGLWKISLDESAADYLDPQRIVDGSSLYLNIYDFAFHPDTDQIYSVDSRGNLLRIEPYTGVSTNLGNVGESGTFGAVYFDVDGFFYISRNKDGKVFKIDLDSSQPQADLFAQGPSSSSNDGARCAIAPVIPVDRTDVDFGDAPESYGTSLASNGARHEVSEQTLYLGNSVDGEAQAYIAPNSDDSNGLDDEDGVVFVTALMGGSQAILRVTASESGFLSGWIDFDLNGRFDEGDRVFADEPLSSGTQTKVINVPRSAKAGTTWARFRVSSLTGAVATGGMPDGEVEDYQVSVSAEAITQQYYPSQNGFVTIAFEDLWPSRGDYDMNDFVINYRTGVSLSNGEVVAVHISGQILAMGATFHNGFAVEIEDLLAGYIDIENIEFEINGQLQPNSPLESGQSNAVFIVASDLWNHVTPAEGCSFYRTESNCGESLIQFGFRIDAPLSQRVAENQFALDLFNPFLFATPGYNRSSIFTSPPGRDLEIHLKNQSPSDLADEELLGRADDRSNLPLDEFYQTENGLPWAIETGAEWIHPREYVDLIDAYPEFVDFVQSEGAVSGDWYLQEKSVTENIYLD